MRHGTPGQRKALIEVNINEVLIDGDRIVPVFKVPETAIEPAKETSTGSSDVVRSIPQEVRRQGLEPRTRGLRVRCSAS